MISLTRVGPGAAILAAKSAEVQETRGRSQTQLRIRRNGGGAVLPALIVQPLLCRCSDRRVKISPILSPRVGLFVV